LPNSFPIAAGSDPRDSDVKTDDKYEAVIGLEVHAQMLTQTKAFCGCSAKFGDEPNSNVCPVCLGMPGTLPVLNRSLVDYILRMGLALDCSISRHAVFARKNYFYPDLPKGYQISQYEEPICGKGFVEIDLDEKTRKQIGIIRIHMEEDAGKSIHDLGPTTMVDLNRCGVPLIEIVSEPDMRSPREASLYLSRIRQIVTYLGICDGNMEEGSLRCDANVSVRLRGNEAFGVKSEVKNMNSFRHVERALEYEIDRQIQLIEEGESVVQETLLWDADRNIAIPMRSKEEAHDYRYFPDPDLVPVVVDEEWLADVRRRLPELPHRRRDRFVDALGLPRYDADVLTMEKEVADYFEESVASLVGLAAGAPHECAKPVSNWVMTEILRVVAERKVSITALSVSPAQLAGLVALITNGTISSTIAKQVFEEMLLSGSDARSIVEAKGLLQVSDPSMIEQMVEKVLADNPSQVVKYREGSRKLFGFFVGETMKLAHGKANPKLVNEILRKRLETTKG
jgi:aspartyl-tRNA(Asn)/glutamyl-tRNA(Gln) amidotransferase subunit B